MLSLLLIGIGGFIGAVLRYLIGGWVQNSVETFPLGTLAVNIAGSFVLSVVMNLSEYRGLLTDETRIFLTIGVLGAFTTMSTFSYETIRLLEQKEIFFLTLNIISTATFCLFAVILGRIVVFRLWPA